MDKVLKQRNTILLHYKESFDSILNVYDNSSDLSAIDKYNCYRHLYIKSHLYQYKYAMACSNRMELIAKKMHNPSLLAEALSYKEYSLQRGGFFKEAIDTLNTIKIPADCPDSIKATYYLNGGRTYHELGNYVKDSLLTLKYKLIGDSLLHLAECFTTDPAIKDYVEGKKWLWRERYRDALPYYLKALQDCKDNDIEKKSVVISTIGTIYDNIGDYENAVHYTAASVKHDVENGIVETYAISNMSRIMFYRFHDVYRSSDYITHALENASYYGTRYRINDIGLLLSVFVSQKQYVEERQKTVLAICFIIISLILIALIFLFKANLKNMGQLHHSQELLAISNKKLDEANKIKNNYLGHYMDIYSETINNVEYFTFLSIQKMGMQQYNSVLNMIKDLNAKYSRKKVLSDFDKTFCSLFPSFLEDFNNLLRPDSTIKIKENSLLSPSLRIYALIRLGINDSEKIAKALGYSYSTVYNYRNRMRKKSLDPKHFEEQVLKIGM